MATGYYVEFHNDDVGPFRTRSEAELYRAYEGNLDETQVFSSDTPSGPWLTLATFCPEAAAQADTRCTCGREVDENGEHSGGCGAFCG